MKDLDQLVSTLKQCLKTKGITYNELSQNLDLSEASVKRIFSENTFTLERLFQILSIIDMTLSELTELAGMNSTPSEYTYTEKQEVFFVKNPKALALFDLIIRFENLNAIKKKYHIPNLYKLLNQLDDLELIELHSQDKIKILVSKNIKWRKKGPLRVHLKPKAILEFISDKFEEKNERLNFLSVELSQKSHFEINKKLDDLSNEILKISALEKKLGNKTQNTGFLLSSRNWEFSDLTF